MPSSPLAAETPAEDLPAGQVEEPDLLTTVNFDEPVLQDPLSSALKNSPCKMSPGSQFDYGLAKDDLERIASWQPDFKRYPKADVLLNHSTLSLSQWQELRYQRWLIRQRIEEIPMNGITDGQSLTRYMETWKEWIRLEKDPVARAKIQAKVDETCSNLASTFESWDKTIYTALDLKNHGLIPDSFTRELEAASTADKAANSETPAGAKTTRSSKIAERQGAGKMSNSATTESQHTSNQSGTTAVVSSAPISNPKLTNNTGAVELARAKLQKEEERLRAFEADCKSHDAFIRNISKQKVPRQMKKVENAKAKLETLLVSESSAEASHPQEEVLDQDSMDVAPDDCCEKAGEQPEETGPQDTIDEQHNDRNNHDDRVTTDGAPPSKKTRTEPLHPPPSPPPPSHLPSVAATATTQPPAPKPTQPVAAPAKEPSTRAHIISTFLPALNTVLQQNGLRTLKASHVKTWLDVEHMYMKHGFWKHEYENLKRVFEGRSESDSDSPPHCSHATNASHAGDAATAGVVGARDTTTPTTSSLAANRPPNPPSSSSTNASKQQPQSRIPPAAKTKTLTPRPRAAAAIKPASSAAAAAAASPRPPPQTPSAAKGKGQKRKRTATGADDDSDEDYVPSA